MKNLIKKLIKEEIQRLKEDKVTPSFVKDFLTDFGILISLNFSQVTKMGKDPNSTKELEEMMKVIRKPIINGKNYFDFVSNNINTIVNNPKLLSALLKQVRELLIYIEPRIQKFVKDEPSKLLDGSQINYKQKWLDRINTLKENYKKIIANSQQNITESIKGNKITCDNCGWKWNLKDGGNDPYVCHKCGHDNNPKTLNEKCWKGYTQKGMKTMFGKRYPNCVKKKN